VAKGKDTIRVIRRTPQKRKKKKKKKHRREKKPGGENSRTSPRLMDKKKISQKKKGGGGKGKISVGIGLRHQGGGEKTWGRMGGGRSSWILLRDSSLHIPLDGKEMALEQIVGKL